MAQTRAEIRRLLEPPSLPAGSNQLAEDSGGGEFPRSRIMKVLLSSRGIGTLGALAGGLFMARPALALRLIRMIPAGPIARMLLVKTIAALRTEGAAHR
jgi:hypothetical protein